MKFSVIEKYLSRQKGNFFTSDIPVSENVSLIIVIPCYNEPDVLKTIESLFRCDRGEFGTEILLIVNSFGISPDAAKLLNRETYHQALQFAEQRNDSYLKLLPLLIEELPGHQTGAGQPRKIGMDEALRRYYSIQKEEGVIVSLDADCLLDSYYLKEIYQAFRDKKLLSATIAFHHPVEHLSENDSLRQSMELYELYLHYYRNALAYIGYPYAYHTVGSAFAVRCIPYVQVGGMGKQQAGEDFYFLQKVFPLGKTREITTTCVYPAARLSNRVPFGTGPALAKMIEEKNIVKYTYSFEAFQILKSFFDIVPLFFKASEESIEMALTTLSPLLKEFLVNDHFQEEMENINRSTATVAAFQKRFFLYFNAFKILKFLNYLHPHWMELQDVRKELKKIG